MDEDQKANTEIIAVSVDGVEKQKMMIDRVMMEYEIEVDFTLLTDVDHRVIDRYGIFNEMAPETQPIPHPTTLVIDKEGVIRWRMTEIDYRVRPTNKDILAALSVLD